MLRRTALFAMKSVEPDGFAFRSLANPLNKDMDRGDDLVFASLAYIAILDKQVFEFLGKCGAMRY